MNAARPAWYVVHTHPHAEARAAAHRVRQGYSIHLPRYLRRRRRARRVDTVARPLFPRYLFVTIDRLAQRWRANLLDRKVRVVLEGDAIAVA
jgi:transcriptional antiterminator RfaH